MGWESVSIAVAVVFGVAMMVGQSIPPMMAYSIQAVAAGWIVFCLGRIFIRWMKCGDGPTGEIKVATPDMRAVDCPEIKDILDSESDRRKFVEQMRKGALTTWAYRNGGRDHEEITPGHWSNASLVYEIVDGVPVTNVLPHNVKRVSPWTKEPVPARIEYWHDVWFNREQLQRHWPRRFCV